MNATTVAIDLAKSVFQLAIARSAEEPVQFLRLSRPQFKRWFRNRSVDLVLMEACGSAHHWARWFQSLGMAVRLLPPHQIRAYVKRNKTDAADALALLEANRCQDLRPVAVKSIEQQCLQSLHRIRSQWVSTRTARINSLRGCLREFGLVLAEGSHRGLEAIAILLGDDNSTVPALLRSMLQTELDEVRLLEQRIQELERRLAAAAAVSIPCEQLLSQQPNLRFVVRARPERVFLRNSSAPRAHQQTRRPIYTHAPHPRRPLRTAGRHHRTAPGKTARSAAHLGLGAPGSHSSQQSSLRVS